MSAVIPALLSLVGAFCLDRAGLPSPFQSYSRDSKKERVWRYQRTAYRAFGYLALVLAVYLAGR